jgi:hypothetical protein
MATPDPTCPPAMKATSNGAFQHENPMDFALPLLIVQICLVVVFTRFIAFLCKPLRQPRVIAEVIVSTYFLILFLNMNFSTIRLHDEFILENKVSNFKLTNDSI